VRGGPHATGRRPIDVAGLMLPIDVTKGIVIGTT
jgi:hypothetical protein